MRNIFFIVFVLMTSGSLKAQIIAMGNIQKICFLEDSSFISVDSLPSELNQFDALMLFSNSTSHLEQKDIDSIVQFVKNGGGLYLGSENSPMQAESNQVTRVLYNKESYGDYSEDIASVSREGELKLQKIDSIPAGVTTVAFPLDYRLNVEAWVKDEPLILTGRLGKGRIIIDGGYSRFYCSDKTENSEKIWMNFVGYLTEED